MFKQNNEILLKQREHKKLKIFEIDCKNTFQSLATKFALCDITSIKILMVPEKDFVFTFNCRTLQV